MPQPEDSVQALSLGNEDFTRSPLQEKKNVFDKKGKLPGHCGTPKDRLGKGRCEDAVVTMWKMGIR